MQNVDVNTKQQDISATAKQLKTEQKGLEKTTRGTNGKPESLQEKQELL